MKIYIRDIYSTDYIEIETDKLKQLRNNGYEMKLDNIDAKGNFYFLMY